MPPSSGVPVHIILHLFTSCCRLQFVTVMNMNYQQHPMTEQFVTAKIPGNAIKQGIWNTLSATSVQLTTAKIQGCANVSSNSSRSEGMWQGWRTPRVDSLKLVNYTRIEDAHKVRKTIFVFYYSCNRQVLPETSIAVQNSSLWKHVLTSNPVEQNSK